MIYRFYDVSNRMIILRRAPRLSSEVLSVCACVSPLGWIDAEFDAESEFHSPGAPKGKIGLKTKCFNLCFSFFEYGAGVV